MSKFSQRSWFLGLGTWTSFSRAMPQDKISINQSINPSRESIISTQKDALRFLLYQRHGISHIPPPFSTQPSHPRMCQQNLNDSPTCYQQGALDKVPLPFPFFPLLSFPSSFPPPPLPSSTARSSPPPSPATPQTKPHRNPASQHKNPRKTNQQHRAGKSSAETSRRS